MAVAERKNQIWTQEEIDVLNAYINVPTYAMLAKMMGRAVGSIKTKLSYMRSFEILNAEKKIQNHTYNAENRTTTRINELAIRETIRREKMFLNLKVGQTILAVIDNNKIPQKMKIISNDGSFVTCKIAHNGRITSLGKGAVISKEILVAVIQDILEEGYY